MLKLSAPLLFLALAVTARAEWKILSAESEPGLTIEHRHVVLQDGAHDQRADVDLAIFSTRSHTLRLIDNERGEMDLAQAMKRDKCFAGVNGGYFDPNFAPIGLRIDNGKVLSPLRQARLISAVLTASARGVQIVRAGEFTRRHGPRMAIQCGPFLVDVGKQVRGLDDSRSARRTFAANATNGRAALGVSSEVTLSELSEILAVPKLAGDLKIDRALNLDGGSSSAFWFARARGSAFSIPEQKTVRDFVGIVPSR